MEYLPLAMVSWLFLCLMLIILATPPHERLQALVALAGIVKAVASLLRPHHWLGSLLGQRSRDQLESDSDTEPDDRGES